MCISLIEQRQPANTWTSDPQNENLFLAFILHDKWLLEPNLIEDRWAHRPLVTTLTTKKCDPFEYTIR